MVANNRNGRDDRFTPEDSSEQNDSGYGRRSSDTGASVGTGSTTRGMGHDCWAGSRMTPPRTFDPKDQPILEGFLRKAPERRRALVELAQTGKAVPADPLLDDGHTWQVVMEVFPPIGGTLPEGRTPWEDSDAQRKYLTAVILDNLEWYADEIHEQNAKKAKAKREGMGWEELPFQKGKNSIPTTNNTGSDTLSQMGNSNSIPIASLPRPRAVDQERHVPDSVQPIAGTTFAPPYVSSILRQRPELAPGLHHVNCSYLTAKTRPRGAGGSGRTFESYGINADAPTLGELKQHVQSLLYLIKQIGFSTAAAEIDAANHLKQIQGDGSADQSYKDQVAPPNIVGDSGVFDFLHNLDHEYKPKEAYDKMPLTHLLNTVEWTDNHSDATVNVCPLIRLPAEAIGRNQHPMPFARLEALMEHADSALLMIDDALSASGGLLSALPMNLPADDVRRKTFLSQMIHFMRVMVSKVHTLDKAYGSALDCLAGEATVPRYLMTQSGVLNSEEDMKTAFVEQQQQYILTGIQQEAYTQIWYEMQKKGAAQAENNGYGLYDVYIPTRYRGLVGGKTVFITPDPARMGEGLAGEERNIERPTVIAVRRPGPATETSEWLRKHTAKLDEANRWEQRALEAEEKVKKLERDVEYLTPEVMLEEVPGQATRMTATEAWQRVTKKEDGLRLKLLDRSVYAQRNRELEVQNKLLEQENDRLTRWRQHDMVGFDVNERLMKENTNLLQYLKEAANTWKATHDELQALRQDIEDRDENARFELQMLKDAHENRVNTMQAQLSLEVQKNQNGAEVVNRRLAMDNITLRSQVKTLGEMHKWKQEEVEKLEAKVKELPHFETRMKLKNLQYKTLNDRYENLMKEWREKERKYGGVRSNALYNSEVKLEEAKAELDDQKKGNQKLLGQLRALQAKYSNMIYDWEDEAKRSGNRDWEAKFRELREKYQWEVASLEKKIKDLEDKLMKKGAKCDEEKNLLRQDMSAARALYESARAEKSRLQTRNDQLEAIAEIHKKCPREKRNLEVNIRDLRQELQTIAKKATEIIKEESDKHVANTAEFVRIYDQLLARYDITLFTYLQLKNEDLKSIEFGSAKWNNLTSERNAWIRDQNFGTQCTRLDHDKWRNLVGEDNQWSMASAIVNGFEKRRGDFVRDNTVDNFDASMNKLRVEREVLKKKVDEAEVKEKTAEKDITDFLGQIEKLKEEEKRLKKMVEEEKTDGADLEHSRVQIEELVAEQERLQAEVDGTKNTLNQVYKEKEELEKSLRSAQATAGKLMREKQNDAYFAKYVKELGTLFEGSILDKPVTNTNKIRLASAIDWETLDNKVKPVAPETIERKHKKIGKAVLRFREAHKKRIEEWKRKSEQGDVVDLNKMDVDLITGQPDAQGAELSPRS